MQFFELLQQQLVQVGTILQVLPGTVTLLIHWSTSELNRQLNPTTCLGDTGCWIQQVTAPTLVVTCWIQQPTCILHSSWTLGGLRPPVQVDDKMHVGCWIQQVKLPELLQ